MELRAQGWSISATGREVGVSRTWANNWTRGYKTYRRGEVIGFVSPLDPLAVRQVSARYLGQDERIVIADLRRAGLSVRRDRRQARQGALDGIAGVAPQWSARRYLPAI
jgi:transposase, IS30 family